MTNLAKSSFLVVALALAAYLPMTYPSSAISADLAKKCRAMAVKAHPSPLAGNKANGAEKAQRDYFQACVAKGGEMDKN
jgi:hypothetical protein